MSRSAFASALVLLLSAVTVSSALAQVKAAPAAAPAAAAPGKWVAPVKGIATVDMVQTNPKIVGKEIVTALKLKNTSTGSISLLKVDQLWYDAKRAVISSATTYYRKPFLPGEIIDIELRAPLAGKPDVNQMTFAHANGAVKATKIAAFK